MQQFGKAEKRNLVILILKETLTKIGISNVNENTSSAQKEHARF